MKTSAGIHRLILLSAAFLPAMTACADPIELPEKPITPEITFLISFAILLEAACILLVLRRSRKPRFFILWLLGVHLFTYPAFLGFLWLEQNIRPALAAGIGEGLVVLTEGALIYLICRFVPPSKPELGASSITKCLLASLIGNIVSAAAFPVLLTAYEHFIAR